MAVSMNLRDLINPQYGAVTGRKLKTPYAAYLTAMGPYARAAAVQARQDALREKELLQGQTNFDASQTLEREKLGAAESQAGKATSIAGMNTAITAASLANQAGIINLKDIASGAGGVVKDAAGNVVTGVKNLFQTAAEKAAADAAAEPASQAAAAAMAASEAGGLGGTAVGSLAGGEAAGAVSAEQAAAAMYASEAGGAGGIAAAEAGGATVGSVASGVGSAVPYYALWKAGMPILRDIIAKGTKSAFGVDRDSSNVIAQMNRVAGDQRGVITPLYEEISGNEMPKEVQWLINPAGSLLSSLFGKDKGGCIIVTACTSPDSEEVNISREYRDKFLSPEQLRGYYTIAEMVVPQIQRFPLVKRLVKRLLVDNLIAYGRHALDKGPYPGPLAHSVTKQFLRLCGTVGSRRPHFVRCNGETV